MGLKRVHSAQYISMYDSYYSRGCGEWWCGRSKECVECALRTGTCDRERRARNRHEDGVRLVEQNYRHFSWTRIRMQSGPSSGKESGDDDDDEYAQLNTSSPSGARRLMAPGSTGEPAAVSGSPTGSLQAPSFSASGASACRCLQQNKAKPMASTNRVLWLLNYNTYWAATDSYEYERTGQDVSESSLDVRVVESRRLDEVHLTTFCFKIRYTEYEYKFRVFYNTYEYNVVALVD